MRNLTLLGAVLIVVGVLALVIGHFSYTDTRPVLKAGPLQVNAEEEHRISIPTIGGIAVLLAGVGLVFLARRQA